MGDWVSPKENANQLNSLVVCTSFYSRLATEWHVWKCISFYFNSKLIGSLNKICPITENSMKRYPVCICSKYSIQFIVGFALHLLQVNWNETLQQGLSHNSRLYFYMWATRLKCISLFEGRTDVVGIKTEWCVWFHS